MGARLAGQFRIILGSRPSTRPVRPQLARTPMSWDGDPVRRISWRRASDVRVARPGGEGDSGTRLHSQTPHAADRLPRRLRRRRISSSVLPPPARRRAGHARP